MAKIFTDFRCRHFKFFFKKYLRVLTINHWLVICTQSKRTFDIASKNENVYSIPLQDRNLLVSTNNSTFWDQNSYYVALIHLNVKFILQLVEKCCAKEKAFINYRIILFSSKDLSTTGNCQRIKSRWIFCHFGYSLARNKLVVRSMSGKYVCGAAGKTLDFCPGEIAGLSPPGIIVLLKSKKNQENQEN